MDVDGLMQGVGTVATIAAAWLAYFAIRQSSKVSKRNELALIRERRIDFQLGVISDLIDAWQLQVGDQYERRMKSLAAMLPISLIPLTRARFNLASKEESVARFVDKDPNSVDIYSDMLTELHSAVAALLAERDQEGRLPMSMGESFEWNTYSEHSVQGQG